MTAGGQGERRDRDLDWENLQAPVPMDLIDPEFAAPEFRPGAASEALPREESDALARAAGADPAALPSPAPEPAQADSAASPASGNPPGRASETGAAASVPAKPDAAGRPASPGSAFGHGGNGDDTTLIGSTEDLEDEFARIRAEMEAEAEIEKRKKLEAEREEAAQRERLEQWMANARARLLKADADLTGPAGRVRIRKESSPSLYRLAEMQKTMSMAEEPTVPDGTRSLRTEAPAPDPMATISVPAAQFLGLDSGQTRGEFPARIPFSVPTDNAARPAPDAPAAPQAQAPNPAPDSPHAASAESPVAFLSGASQTDPSPSGGSGVFAPVPLAGGPADTRAGGAALFAPMTREEALARKVAKLRQTAEEGENTLALAPAPGEDGESRALNIAIAAVVLIAVVVLGLGLFAATQAGLFDGLEYRLPFLKPKVGLATQPRPVPAPAAPEAAPPPPPSEARPSLPAPAAAAKDHAPGRAAPAARPRAAAPVSAPSRTTPVTQAPPSRKGVRTTAETPARPPRAAGRRPAPAAEGGEDGEIPAYARARPKGPGRAEDILRNAVQTAASIDKYALKEMYNRYALGYPGLSGEVVIGLTVDPGGRILEGSIVNSTTGVDAFDQELLRKVLEWRLGAFPETRPRFITVPFLFPMQGH